MINQQGFSTANPFFSNFFLIVLHWIFQGLKGKEVFFEFELGTSMSTWVEEKWSIINLLWADIHNLICEVDMNNKLSVIRRNQNLFQIYSFLKEIWLLCFSSWDDIKNECYAAPCFGLKFFLQFSTECGRFKCVRFENFWWIHDKVDCIYCWGEQIGFKRCTLTNN